MPIATLSFTLPEERTEHDQAVRGADWYLLVVELLEHIRTRTRHTELTERQHEVYDHIRDTIHTIARDRNLPLE